MAESSYYITLAYSAGTWTPSALKEGTAASGGTALTIPWVENANSGTGDTTSKNLKTAAIAAFLSLVNDFVTNTPSNRYSINIVNDGSGTFTPASKRDATAASGGTALTIPWVENANSGTADTTSQNLKTAFIAAFLACVNDYATNA